MDECCSLCCVLCVIMSSMFGFGIVDMMNIVVMKSYYVCKFMIVFVLNVGGNELLIMLCGLCFCCGLVVSVV